MTSDYGSQEYDYTNTITMTPRVHKLLALVVGLFMILALVIALSVITLSRFSGLQSALTDAYCSEAASLAIADFLTKHKSLPRNWEDLESSFAIAAATGPNMRTVMKMVDIDFTIDLSSIDVSSDTEKVRFRIIQTKTGAELSDPRPNQRVWEAIRKVRCDSAATLGVAR